jgi:hypothetical protein
MKLKSEHPNGDPSRQSKKQISGKRLDGRFREQAYPAGYNLCPLWWVCRVKPL